MSSPIMSAAQREAIFQRWLAAHLGLMAKVARGCTATAQDYDELLQDILVQVWSSIPGFRGEAKETTWIYRVAFNTALAWRRDERRRRERHESFVRLSQPPEAVAPASGDDTVERLYAAVQALPKLERSLALMHLDNLSYREMAEVLGISETNVGVKLTRIRRKLAEQLKGAIDEL